MFCCLQMTRRYMSVTTHSAAETLQDMPGLHRDVLGCFKDTPDGYTDLADTREWGLMIVVFLADVSLLIRDFYDNIAGVLVGASDHWIPGSQWL